MHLGVRFWFKEGGAETRCPFALTVQCVRSIQDGCAQGPSGHWMSYNMYVSTNKHSEYFYSSYCSDRE